MLHSKVATEQQTEPEGNEPRKQTHSWAKRPEWHRIKLYKEVSEGQRLWGFHAERKITNTLEHSALSETGESKVCIWKEWDACVIGVSVLNMYRHIPSSFQGPCLEKTRDWKQLFYLVFSVCSLSAILGIGQRENGVSRHLAYFSKGHSGPSLYLLGLC